MTSELQDAKQVVLKYYDAFDTAPIDQIVDVLRKHTADGYSWRGIHPFYEQSGVDAVAKTFWVPLRQAFSPLQRRPDVFFAGANTVGDGREVWVCQMGHLLGLFDRPWLGIPPTQRMCFLRYAEFHRVDGDRIAETALFLDVISVMQQAGQDPLPPQTGASHLHPGPLTHDGVLLEAEDPDEGNRTMALVDKMIDDLHVANLADNEDGDDRMSPKVLATAWHNDMLWFGPAGIGATYTIDRYQQQHQFPFRLNLTGKFFHGHIARCAEGNYAGFFGWANLTNTPTGGFLGLPGSDVAADMRVVDIYRRDGDKLAENWVFIELLHWLHMQGLDVLARMRQLTGQEKL